MKMPDLMWYLGEVPVSRRKMSDLDFTHLVVYHLTKAANIDDIKAHGIKAKSSSQSYDRPAAVYFFADKSEINSANIDILGLSGGYRILRVKIPAREVLSSLKWDGLYNVSFGLSASAVQYFGDIPTDWIVSYDYKV